MNLFLKEIKFNLKALLIWCICIAALLGVAVGKEFAMMESGGESINEVMNTLPKTAKVVLGMNDYDLSKVEGYYSMMSMYVFIILAIHASMLGARDINQRRN